MKNPAGIIVLSVLAAASLGAQPALTIYNQNFAVVRDTVPLTLKAGENSVSYSGVTTHLEPDSVVLRDPTGRIPLQILEQSYRADTASSGLLLSLNEGRTIDFVTRDQDGRERTVSGRIIRSGYQPNLGGGIRYGNPYAYQQQEMGANQGPIIEVDGKLRFSLPGEPIFPALPDDSILKPTLTWQIATPSAAKCEAELSYLTEGMTWDAAYNLVAPEKGDTVDLLGWVSIDNQSGRGFDNAHIKLMAGDVNKVTPALPNVVTLQAFEVAGAMAGKAAVTEKAFDEYHLYSLPRPTTLRNRETKQVEFIHATGIKAKSFYVYQGAELPGGRNRSFESIRGEPDYGTQSNPKVWVMREFVNSEANGLGVPLPAGRLRLYRRDNADGQLEFVGENTIDHTPKDETVRVYSGNAFDVVGERKRTAYNDNNRAGWMEEAFEIRLRNHKLEPVEVRVAERLYRWSNWSIMEESEDHTKIDANDIEYRVTVPASGEYTLNYRVRYIWK